MPNKYISRWDSDSEEEGAPPTKKSKGNNDEANDDNENEVRKSLNNFNYPSLYQNKTLRSCRNISDHFEFLSFLSEGTYGTVFKAKVKNKSNDNYIFNSNGENVAIKQIKFTRETNRTGFPITALRECRLLLMLSRLSSNSSASSSYTNSCTETSSSTSSSSNCHPNIIRMYEMVIGEATDKFYMIMELGEMDLSSYINKSIKGEVVLDLEIIKSLMRQLVSAVAYMHEHWIIHRDLKPPNLLLFNSLSSSSSSSSLILKIADFGMARTYDDPLKAYTPNCITGWYRAPEMLLGQRIYSTAVDDWSVGCIFAELLQRKPLFPAQSEVEQRDMVFRICGLPSEQSWPGVSALLGDKTINWKLPTGNNNLLPRLFGDSNHNSSSNIGNSHAFNTDRKTLTTLPEVGLKLLTGLLCLCPERRLSSVDACEDEWLGMPR